MRALAAARRRYAEELRELSRLRSELLVEAFARVPREHYLGPGPWRVLRPDLKGGYTDTPDADPRHLYHDVLVAIDEERRLNAELPWVEVQQADGSQRPLPPSDAVFVNAGATHPARGWLECLKPSGRLLFPLTVSSEPTLPGFGHYLRIVREEEGFSARFVSPVGGAANERLRAAYGRGGEAQVRRLRLDEHALAAECWLHAPDFCLS